MIVCKQLFKISVLGWKSEVAEVFPQPGVFELRVRGDSLIATCELVHDLDVRQDISSCVGGPLAPEKPHSVKPSKIAEMGAADNVSLIDITMFCLLELCKPRDACRVVQVVVIAVVVEEEACWVVVPDDSTYEVVDITPCHWMIPKLVECSLPVKCIVRSDERSNGHSFMHSCMHLCDTGAGLK